MLKSSLSILKEEEGAVLIIALLIMVILALIGAAAIMNSSIEIKIAGNERLGKLAFYAADAGVEIAPRIIDYFIEDSPDPAGFPGNLREDLQDLIKDRNFLNEIMGYTTNNDGSTDNPDNNPDIQTIVEGKEINMDIDRIYTEYAVGGSAESLGGYEGIGSEGTGGGIAIYYRANSVGKAANNTRSNVEIIYRYVL
jgi:Tfp pilus assembly protein PilX